MSPKKSRTEQLTEPEAGRKADSSYRFRDNEQEFWDRLAPTYGKRRSLEGGDRLKLVTEFLISRGAIHPQASVLDIGSGPGVYALLFAPYAREVTALDSAPRMCTVLRERALERGLTNITVVNKDWREVELSEEGWERRFDLVFASLTPAVRDPQTLMKMVAASRKFCCLVEFARGHRNPVLIDLWDNVVGGPFPGGRIEASYPWNFLYASGYLPDIYFVPDFWEEELPLEEAVSRYRLSLSRFVTVTAPVEKKIRRYFNAKSPGGVFRFSRRGYLAVLLWRVDVRDDQGAH